MFLPGIEAEAANGASAPAAHAVSSRADAGIIAARYKIGGAVVTLAGRVGEVGGVVNDVGVAVEGLRVGGIAGQGIGGRRRS